MSNAVELSVLTTAVYGYHFLRAELSPIRCVVVDSAVELKEGVRLCLHFEPEVFLPWEQTLGQLSVGKQVFVPRPLEAVPSALLSPDSDRLKIVCSLEGETTLCETSVTVPLYGFATLPEILAYPHLTAAFVTEEAWAVRRLAGQVLENGKRFSYARSTREQARRLVQQLYELMHRQELTYAVAPFSAEKKEHTLRLSAQCLAEKTGNSPELGFTFASVLSAAGLECVLLWYQNALMLGVYLSRPREREVCCEDAAAFYRRVSEGELLALDPAGICYGTNIPFSISENAAAKALETGEDFVIGVDVTLSRRQGCRSVPAELYENRDALANKEILTWEEKVKEPDPLSLLAPGIFQLPQARSLFDCPYEPAPISGEQALEAVEILWDGQPDPQAPGGPCLGVGQIGYTDPVTGQDCTAYALLAPLEEMAPGRYEKKKGFVLNTVLFEKIGAISGFFTSRLQQTFQAQGAKVLLEELSQMALLADRIRWEPQACCLGWFAPELCLYLDSLAVAGLPGGEESIPCGLDHFHYDRSYQGAVKSALEQELSYLRCADASLRDTLLLELCLQALAQQKKVLAVVKDPESFKSRVGTLAKKYREEPGLEPVPEDYLEQVFRVHPQGFSFFQAHLLYDKYKKAPDPVEIPSCLVADLKEEDVIAWSRQVTRLIEAMEAAGGICQNPLRFVENPVYSEEHAKQAQAACQALCRASGEYLEVLEALRTALRLERLDAPEDVERVQSFLDTFGQGEGVPGSYYAHAGAHLSQLIAVGKEHALLSRQLENTFSREVFRLDAPALLAKWRSASLLPSMRRKAEHKQVLHTLRACANQPKALEADRGEEYLQQLIRREEYATYVVTNAESIKECFGVDVLSPGLDGVALWSRLEQIDTKAQALREIYRRLEGAKVEELSILVNVPDLAQSLAQLDQRLSGCRQNLAQCFEEANRRLSLQLPRNVSWSERHQTYLSLQEGLGGLSAWTQWLRTRSAALELGLRGVVEQCESGRFDGPQLRLNFLRGFFGAVGHHILSVSGALRSDGDTVTFQVRTQRLTNQMAYLCQREVANGFENLICVDLFEAHRLPAQEAFSLLVVQDSHRVSAVAGAGLLKLGHKAVLIGGPLPCAQGESLGQLALRCGGQCLDLTLSYDHNALAAHTAGAFSADCGGLAYESAFFHTDACAPVQLCRVSGGYDPATGTNIIEASLVVDQLEEWMHSGQDTLTVVCLGEAQRRLVTLVLAKRLAADPSLKQRFLQEFSERIRIRSLDEHPERADTVLVSLCFGMAQPKYGQGLSLQLARVLGENAGAKLMELFTLANRQLCVACSFSWEELKNTRSGLRPMREFAWFAARLFSLPQAATSTQIRPLPTQDMADALAEHLVAHGFTVWQNVGFGAVRADLLIGDPADPARVLAAVITDDALQTVCAEPWRYPAYLQQLSQSGLCVLHLRSLDWFLSEQEVKERFLSRLQELADPSRAWLEPTETE